MKRYLGYRGEALLQPLKSELEAAVVRAVAMLAPRGLYRTYPVVARTERELVLEGGGVIGGKVAEYLGAADFLGLFVVTVGSKVTDAARQAAEQGDPVTAWVFDAVGSYGAEATADGLAKRLREALGEGYSVSPRYSPGYCGMALGEQRALFQLVNASAIAVELMPSMVMQPTKSISGIFGIAPAGIFEATGYPCQRCESESCLMRRD